MACFKTVVERLRYMAGVAKRDDMRNALNAAADEVERMRFVLRRDRGYAPGDYFCQCQECHQEHIADKRARICIECADRLIDERLPLLTANVKVSGASQLAGEASDSTAGLAGTETSDE